MAMAPEEVVENVERPALERENEHRVDGLSAPNCVDLTV
jgi:hypothetical protein